MSEPVLRPMASADLPAVLALNQGALDAVGTLDAERLAWLVDLAEQALVVDDDGSVAAFVVTVPPGSAYDSPNYRWFESLAADQGWAGHRYLDRVVVAPTHRRRGLASLMYDAIESGRSSGVPVTLEVYVEPPNEASLAFHAARGYGEVGRSPQANGKTCTMLMLF